MIKSRYFPDVLRCLAEIPNGDDKIEIPADVYDENKISSAQKNFILRGNYSYETVKIIAQSGCVEALEFDETSGEIKTKSTYGISAEMDFAFAFWNFYDKDSALERVILSWLQTKNELPQIFSNDIGEIKIEDAINIKEDFAKALAKELAIQIKDRIQTGTTLDVEVSMNVSKVPKVFQVVGDIFSTFWDEIVLLGRHATDIKDFVNGRISTKQLAKNAIVTTAGVSGASYLYVLGGSVAAVAGAPAILVFLSAAATGYWGKVSYREVAKNFFNNFIIEDNQKMLEIFHGELVKMLSGKFLTIYETGILMEAIRADLNQNAFKEMYSCGTKEKQTNWAQSYIQKRLDEIFQQRIFIEMPSATDWAAGIQRINKRLANGENILEEMEHSREDALKNMRDKLLKFKLKPYEMGTIISAVNAMNKTQLRAQRVLEKMQRDELHYKKINQSFSEDTTKLKGGLNELLEDFKNL